MRYWNYRGVGKLSTTYETVTGDTFNSIARKRYGEDQFSDTIAKANPSVLQPLLPGSKLTIPAIPEIPANRTQSTISDNPTEVAILIDNQRFRFWNSVKITRSLDSIDTIQLSAPFEAENAQYRSAFIPLKYQDIEVTVGGMPLFNGTALNITPQLRPVTKSFTLSGYALPGVLHDCTAPASAYPIQFQGQGLREIAKALLEPFGLGLDFTVDQGSVFPSVSSTETGKLLAFLTKLANQRNLIMSSDPLGKLLITRSVDTGQPVSILEQGLSPLNAVRATFKPQEYYSDITGIQPSFLGISGSKYTVKNPRLTGVVRPFVFKVPDTLTGDLKTATEAKAARMFANSVSYTVSIPSWRDSSNNLWQPNTTVKLLAPDAMIYSSFEFLIRTVEFSKDPDKESVVLSLVLPGVFNAQLPEVLPWDE